MSNLKRCDRCGLSVPSLTLRSPEGWVYLSAYNESGDPLSIVLDICPACKDAAFEFFKPSAEKV